MSLYRDLQKDDPTHPAMSRFRLGWATTIFRSSRRNGGPRLSDTAFTVYRWTKDDRQDNEALDTAIIATGAAIRFGVYGLSDQGWAKLRTDRETPIAAKPPLGAGEKRVHIASRLAR